MEIVKTKKNLNLEIDPEDNFDSSKNLTGIKLERRQKTYKLSREFDDRSGKPGQLYGRL